jgi:hypothetical protein
MRRSPAWFLLVGCGWMVGQSELITDITPEGRYSQDNSSGVYCVRFAHLSDIFPDVDDLRGVAWLRHLY